MPSLFKAFTVVALSLLAAMSGNAPLGVRNQASVVARVSAQQVGPCVADPQTLCLNGGRFKVQVNWRVPSQGTNGVGTAVALTGDTGYFWFFSSNNVELVIKVLDGRAFNGMYWVFYGALSDVEYTITVTDTVTGAVRTYSNPSGTLASVADTAAFAGGSSSIAGPGAASLEAVPLVQLVGPCVAGSSTLCLNNGRFKVEVAWRVPSQGTSGAGTAVPLTGDTGYFWFFSSNNVELVIKVLDGTLFNGKFWVFYGALSNVEYTITVTDTATGVVKTYVNPSGNLASVADTSAFDPMGTAPTATPTPTPTPTPTQPMSTTRIVNVGQNGSTSFVDTVSGNNVTSIRVGDTVQWKFLSNISVHSTTSGACTSGGGGYYDNPGGCSADGQWDSGLLSPPATFSKTFTTAGTYYYYCQVHTTTMTGAVRVGS